ncbi:unnamed protein product [Heligmosomoides polygyrus]|uniref:G_PROTEIN_RECEP_F1_2 domain-containing protein n=1 Tax=Heligmosomoides polygyrus TaxID=6339 RepID=A0A183GP83_HELPZ|nr:unnamed protein product [Heligmosomoides polygyrus]
MGPALLIRFFLYSTFGLILCVLNTVCIIVFSSSKELRTKYALFNALSIADFLNGLSFVLFTKMDCLFRTPFGLLLSMRAQKRCKMNDSIKQVFIAFVLISGQFPALLHVLLAADRVMALCFPMWYRETLENGSLENVLIVIAGLNNALDHGANANRMCAVMNSTGIIYGTLHFSLIGFAYLLCLISLCAIFRNFNRKMVSNLANRRLTGTCALFEHIMVDLQWSPCTLNMDTAYFVKKQTNIHQYDMW